MFTAFSIASIDVSACNFFSGFKNKTKTAGNILMAPMLTHTHIEIYNSSELSVWSDRRPVVNN